MNIDVIFGAIQSRGFVLFSIIVIGLQASGFAETAPSGSADVLVYGATPGGVCAAVGAAREGVSVILLEPTKHVGGVNTGGLCFSDSNQMARAALRGLFEEFHQRMEDDQRIDYARLRERLLAQKQALELP